MQRAEIGVMQIISDLDIGGAQEVVRTLAANLSRLGCRVVVCTFCDGPLREDIEKHGIQVEILPSRRHSVLVFPLFIADMIRIWRELARLVEKHDSDVIQTHLLRSLDFLILLLRYTTRARAVLWTFHSANFVLTPDHLPRFKWLLGTKNFLHHLLYRTTARLVDGLIAVSDEVKTSMIKTIGPIQDKILVMPNGVDVSRYGRPEDKTLIRQQLGLAQKARLIIMVGALKEVKGHRHMIKALASIVPQHPDVQAIFLGDGPLKQDLQFQVKALDLDSHVHFLGNRSNVAQWLAASDFFALPSLWEGLSMALLEAMVTGLPIVASRVSGTEKAIIPGQTGLLITPGDSQQLAQAIEQLLYDPRQAQAMGAAARRLVIERFSAEKQARDHQALYSRLLNGVPPQHKEPLPERERLP
ncbi:MAG: glycosyltransferase family 4 protein [Chloroflexota bacterium]